MAIRREGKRVDDLAMSMQRGPVGALFHIPEPNDLVKASTGDRSSIRTPGYRMHPFRMSPQRLKQASAGDIPELDGLIPTATDQGGPIGGKGQLEDPVRMPAEDLNAGGWGCPLDLPESNLAIEIATCQQMAIGTPGSVLYGSPLVR